LNATRDVNEETTNFNRKLNELATKLMPTRIVYTDLSRKYFTQQRLHMKNTGKEEIINRVVEAIRTTQGNSTEIIPVSLTWRDTPYIIKGNTS